MVHKKEIMDTVIIDKLFEDYLEISKNSVYYLSKSDKENLLSFIEGYCKGRKDKKLINYLGLYLYHHHQIDMTYNDWKEQIDHYSYIKGLDWFDGFYTLLDEVLENKGELASHTKIPTYEPESHIPVGEQKEVVYLANNSTLKVGDFIQLGDKIGEDYKQTKFYDASLRNPSWDLFYPSEKDFKHIYFYLPEENEMGVSIFGRVRGLLSNSIAQIEEIRVNNDKIIAYTDSFKIDAKEAFQQGEFKTLNNQNNDIILTDLSDLKEKFLGYTMGFLLSLTEEINKWCFYSLHELKKDWHIYRFSMGRQWDRQKLQTR